MVIGWLTSLGCDPFSISDASTRFFAGSLAGLAFALLGSFIFLYQPHNRVGWLALGIAFCLPGSIALDLYVQCGLAGTISAPGKMVVAWLLYSYGAFPIIPLVVLLPMVYPTGRFLSPFWRQAALIGLAGLAIAGTGAGLNPDFSQVGVMYFFPLENPFGLASLPSWWPATLDIINELGFAGLRLVAIAAIIARFRQSRGDERQQIKWLVYYIALVFGVTVLFFNLPANLFGLPTRETIWFSLIVIVSFVGIPIVMGVAIFKYRLYAIDLVINRTLVYGGLTLLITAVYVLLVSGIGTLAADQSGQIIGLVLATGVVVVGIRPLHRSLQTTTDRVVTVPDSPPDREFKGEQTILATKKPPQPRPRWVIVGAVVLALAALLSLASLVLAGCGSFSYLGVTGISISFASGLAFSTLGVLILAYRPHNRIGWLCLWIGIGLPGVSAIDIYANCGLAEQIAAPALAYLAWFSYSFGVFFPLVPMFILLPMLYPTGTFLSPRWQWVTVVGLILVAINGAAIGLLPDLSRDNGFETFFAVANPFGISNLPQWWYSFFSGSSNLTVIALSLVGITAMVVRFRRSVGDERQQMKWLAYFLGTAVVIQLLFFELPGAFFYPEIFSSIWYNLIIIVVFLGFPTIIGLAIFKYRLYDIDLIINRTLVYGGLTLAVVLIYSLTVGGLGLLFQTSGNFVISLVATALIAIAFQPVRERLQRAVNRFMFGQRDDPYAVLSHLSQQLQTTAVPAETLTSIVETIAGTLKLPYAAIELVEQEQQIGRASVGEPVGEPVELPLRYQKETVGRLLVSPRAPGERFTAKEQQLLADIAAQTGPVASATRLTLALQRSREKLVLAREEERRRIRRDLHDGLGPTLAGQTLQLDSILDLLVDDPEAATGQVAKLKSQTQQMVADIRRLVYELRPPALDELGLLEALRAHVAQMQGANGRLRITIAAAPEPLPPLPAAIEVAAYRIALEGITNVIRHAQARQCRVQFVVTADQTLPGLVITITDDGRGLPAKFQSGVGLISMQERAEELGGVCTVGAAQNQGTQIRAVLPFSVS